MTNPTNTTVVKRAPGRPADPNSLFTKAKEIYNNYPDAANSRQAVLAEFTTKLIRPDTGTPITPKAASVYYQIIKNPRTKHKRPSKKKTAVAVTP